MVTGLEQVMSVYIRGSRVLGREMNWCGSADFGSDHTRVGTPLKQWHYLFLSFFSFLPQDCSLEDNIFSSLCLKVIALWMKMKPLKIPPSAGWCDSFLQSGCLIYLLFLLYPPNSPPRWVFPLPMLLSTFFCLNSYPFSPFCPLTLILCIAVSIIWYFFLDFSVCLPSQPQPPIHILNFSGNSNA